MEALFRQALARQKAGHLEEAEALYRQSAAWKPEWTLGNLGVILRTTGRLEEAEAVLRAALAADPANAPVRHSLGMTLLQLGKYAEGWALYEARRELHPAPAPPPLPEWRGESLAGKRIVVVAEQGLGDQILLSRFLPRLQAGAVALACSRPLVRLLSALPAEVFNPQAWDGVVADCWTYLASVPRWLELGPQEAPAPYLPCPPRPPAGVGLMLDGAQGNPNNAQRLPGAAAARAIRGLGAFVDLSPEASGARDFADTAEIVGGLERVVTVDTSVAHLAGAMGKPCLVLMAYQAVDWYTNRRDDRTPWYPSLRLIRQRRAGDWAGVVADLAAALSKA
jgi:tetratricopeptide (TPR) repeat protein